MSVRLMTPAAFAVGAAVAFAVVASFKLAPVAASGDWTSSASPLQSLSAESVYEYLSREASADDERAVDLKASIDAYLTTHDLTIADLDDVTLIDGHEDVGMQRFMLGGAPPFDVRVSNATIFTSADEFATYRSLRLATLGTYASTAPDAIVDAVLSPSGIIPVSKFLAELKCLCTVSEMTADVFVGDVWVMQTGATFPDVALGDAEAGLAQLTDQAQSTLDMFPTVRSTQLSLMLHSIRLKLTASVAQAIADRDDVLLVDLTSDTKEIFRDRAIRVTVADTPDVFQWYATNQLGLAMWPTSLQPTEPEGR